jgi:apolipoprotein N-acyltransferase
MTPYARFGDWFSWLCVIVTIAILFLALKPRAPEPALQAAKPVR